MRRRTKNLFKRKLKKSSIINSYADIKANLLVEIGSKSLVCELQFLLKTMIEAKKLDHSLYEVLMTMLF